MSYTFTIESTGGNGIVVPGYGFLLNNELTDFNYDSTTHPNRVEGSKRPRSSMSPTIIESDGKPFLAVGSPGGSTIIGTVLQTIVNRIDLGSRCRTRSRCRAPSSATRRTTQAEQAFIDSQEGRARRRLRTQVRPARGAGRDRRRDGHRVPRQALRRRRRARPPRRGRGRRREAEVARGCAPRPASPGRGARLRCEPLEAVTHDRGGAGRDACRRARPEPRPPPRCAEHRSPAVEP